MYPKVPMKLITKFSKELLIGKDNLSMSPDNPWDITPFYPLLSFPQRDDVKYQQFEKRMTRAESA